MAVTIKLSNGLTSKQEQWLMANVGPRLYYLHNRVGGTGWSSTRNFEPGMVGVYWTLTLEDEKLASYFLLKFT